MKYPILIAALALAGCISEQGVTDAHIARAAELCAPNQGVAKILNAEYQNQLESCGDRCSRVNGMTDYTMRAICKNGAEFAASWEGRR